MPLVAISDAEFQDMLQAHASHTRLLVRAKIPFKFQGTIAVEDVLQEVWMSAWKRRAHFRSNGPKSFYAWLHVIAENTLLNAIKRASCQKRGGNANVLQGDDKIHTSMLNLFECLDAPMRTPSSVVAAAEVIDAMRIALASMPEQRQHVLRSRYLEGRSIAEIAVNMNKSEEAIESLLYHGKRDLRERMGDPARFLRIHG